MRMILSTLVLTLGWFAAINVVASMLVWVRCGRSVSSDRAPRASSLLVIRLLPAALSILFAAGVFLPAHFLFEPGEARETFGLVLYVLAATGGCLLIRSSARALGLWRLGQHLRRRERDAVSFAPGIVEVSGHTGVSLAGVIAPRILIGPDVVRELTSEELDVAIAHELAHRDAFDNLARWAMACAPDLLGLCGRARRIEQAWHEAAESLADGRAVDGDRVRAMHLASALIKVARLSASAPAGPMPAWSTLNHPPLLEQRVRYLLTGPQAPAPPSALTAAAVLTTAAGLIAIGTAAGAPIHHLTEGLVKLLP
jgi:hypothetical protein